jgi:enoyl-[acyl-carrier protein] reductase III
MEHTASRANSLAGKIALVTGGSRGIVRGVAVKLAERGARVAINYVRNEHAARQTLDRIRQSGADGVIIQADVSRPEDLHRLAAQLQSEFGGLDIFVNNALGNLLGFMSPPFQLSIEQWDEAFQCQSRAFFVAMRELANLLRENGRIVAISYWPGSHLGGFLPYFAMGSNKAAIESMCRYFAVALAPRRITVNAICAGLTDDSIVNSLPMAAQQAIFAHLKGGWTPLGRPGTPDDIGGAVAALCSDDAAWITGQTIVADGGASLMSPEIPIDFQRP